MRVMVIVKATADSEAGILPTEQEFAEMGRFNEELVKAGIMLAGDGLHPSSKGYRVRFSGKNRIVTDGPFTETKELIAGYWIWQVKSLEEAIEWVKKCPNPMPGEDSDKERLFPGRVARNHRVRCPAHGIRIIQVFGNHISVQPRAKIKADRRRKNRKRADGPLTSA